MVRVSTLERKPMLMAMGNYGDGSVDVFVILGDVNIERIKAYDPATVRLNDFEADFKATVRMIAVLYGQRRRVTTDRDVGKSRRAAMARAGATTFGTRLPQEAGR
jgi:hypothetical protein